MALRRSSVRFGSEDDLIDRLHNPSPLGKFSFMLGSALSLPTDDSEFGVPGADAIVELIRSPFDEPVRADLYATLGTVVMDASRKSGRWCVMVP